MITAKFHGQLGNNLFQLATLLSIKEQGSKIFLLNTVHRGNIEQINDFFIHPKKLEFNDMFESKFDYFDTDLFMQQFSNKFKLLNHSDIAHNNFFGFSQIKIEDFTILNGYFQSEKYFLNIQDKIKEVYFKPSKEVNNIINKFDFVNSLSIHYRRGGDRHIGDMQQYFQDLEFGYYLKNIRYICNSKKIEKLYIFSDDIKWCKEKIDNLIPLGYNFDVIFIENNKNYVDLFLMSKCENNIIANSTFSWWAAWLNKNTEKIVVAPKTNWFGPKLKHMYLEDLFPKDWILE